MVTKEGCVRGCLIGNVLRLEFIHQQRHPAFVPGLAFISYTTKLSLRRVNEIIVYLTKASIGGNVIYSPLIVRQWVQGMGLKLATFMTVPRQNVKMEHTYDSGSYMYVRNVSVLLMASNYWS